MDMDDKHSCRDALKGAYGCFLVTNYWEVHDESREISQVNNEIVLPRLPELGLGNEITIPSRRARPIL